MGEPYVYQGDPRTYAFGHVTPGAIACFELRPPDGDWVPYVPPMVEEEAPAEAAGAGDGDGLKQPNKAASAADWVAYAEAHGGFQAATGVAPADASRKAIVDHYSQPEGGES